MASFATIWLIVGIFATFIVIIMQYNNNVRKQEEAERIHKINERDNLEEKIKKQIQALESCEEEIKYRRISKDHISDAEIVE